MGKPNVPWYEEDIASAIQTAKSCLAKIETNKYDKQDLIDFAKANNNIIIAAIQNEQ